MKINSDTFLSALNTLAPGIAEKEAFLQSSCVSFINGMAYSINGSIAVVRKSPLLFPRPFALPWKPLVSFLTALAEGEVDVTLKETQLIVTAGRTRAGFQVENEVLQPISDIPKAANWVKLPKETQDVLHLCSLSASSNISTPILCCVHIYGNRVESCDNYRATRAFLPKGTCLPNVLVPKDSVTELCSRNLVAIASSEGFVHFQDDECELVCRTLPQTFPDIDKLFGMDGEKVTLPDELADALRRTSIFSGDDENAVVKVTIKDGKLTVLGQGDFGWGTDYVNTQFSGNVSVSVSPALLTEILTKTNKAIVNSDSLSFHGKNFMHVISVAGS